MKDNRQGFTILEVIIVFLVIAILSGIILAGARTLLHRQRFNQATEHLRSLVQQARNRSQTQVNSKKSFGVYLPSGNDGTVTLFEDGEPKNNEFGAPPDNIIDSIQIDNRDFTIGLRDGNNALCAIHATIIFIPEQSPALFCNNNSVTTLKIAVMSTQSQNIQQNFLMHQAAGILQ